MQSISFILPSGCPATSDVLGFESHCDLWRSKARIPWITVQRGVAGSTSLLWAQPAAFPLSSCRARSDLCPLKFLNFSSRDLASFSTPFLQQTQLWKSGEVRILSHLCTQKLLEMLSSVCHEPATSTNRQKQLNAFCPCSTIAKYANIVPVFSCISDVLESCAEQ